MKAVDDAQMHRDHCQIRSEDDLWRLDIAAWQRELLAAVGDLSKLQTALQEHEKALETHAAAIRAYELEGRRHEHALAAYERGEEGSELIELAGAHGKEIARHEQRRQAHERIKRHHHTMMAQWNLLTKAVGKEL